MRHLQKSGIITLKALGSPIGSRTAQVQEQQLEETKFIAFFMGKKIDIDGKDLYDAKQNAITQLKVPKSKVGLLAVVSAESQRNQDFRFEVANEEAVNEATASDIVKDLDKVRNDLIKKVDVLIAKKKKLYANVDITTPLSADEKKMDKDIQDIFSQIQQIIQQKRKITNESINEGKKVFKVNPGIGKAKYSISSHDGVKKHKDGSDFYDINIFKNKVDLEKGIKDYKSKGFVEESVNEAFSDNKNLNYIMKGKKIKNVVYDDNIGFAIILDNGKYIRFDTHSAKPGMVKDLKMEAVNEENPGLWANIRAKQARGEAPAPKNSKAYKDAVEAGDKIKNEQSIKREALKSIVKEVMQEEAEYQKFFQKVLDKAGKSIPSMSDDEKKAFFNKIDSAWKGKQEGK